MAKILIIDDDIDTTNLLESMVKIKGHQPVSVNNSLSAVEAANSTNPDLILLDIMMPGINGIQLAKCSNRSRLKHIPIIIVSALNDIGKGCFNAEPKILYKTSSPRRA
jgi:two-component system response regulator MtrA